MAGQWWDTGFAATDKAKEQRERDFQPDRFWIPKPESGKYNSKNIIFLSDEPFCFWEHGFKLNGDWVGNYEVCIAGITPPCPMDGLGKSVPISKYFIALFTILDMSEWTDKKGKVHKYQKKVLATKDSLTAKIRNRKEKRSSLIGCEFTLTRDSGDQTPGTGDDIEFVREVNLKELLEVAKTHFTAQGVKEDFIKKFNLDPFEFNKKIKPRSKEEMKALVEEIRGGGGTSSSSGSSEKAGEGDPDIPF